MKASHIKVYYCHWTVLQHNQDNFSVYLLLVLGDKIGFRYLAKEYVGVFITDKILRNFWVLLATVLCTLELPYAILGEVPTGQILLNYFSENLSSFFENIETISYLTF